ncbi:MAG: hypothetical protein J6C55_03610 [Oscillospiraceae bacterium]|nr:hypothetical protein [Oscillospiraceae bacterium]
MTEDKKDKGLHVGHRERLKKQAVLHGIDNWPEHQVLEYLLFFGIPQRDTNELAHKLINKYGSIIGVLEASYDSLKENKGLGDNVANLITLIPKLFKYIENIKVNKKHLNFSNISQVAQYMTPKFYNVSHEVLYVLSLDNKQKLISSDIVLNGVVNRVNIDQRKIVENVISNNASNIVLCHNHPSGISLPSHDDIVATKKIIEIMNEIGVTVLDHIIIADNEYCSMMEMEYINN